MNAADHTKNIRSLVHEFNNVLFVISGHCEVLSQDLPPDSSVLADLKAIAAAAERATALTARLRALVKPEGQSPTETSDHASD